MPSFFALNDNVAEFKVMRQLGFNPTEAEVADLVRLVDTEGATTARHAVPWATVSRTTLRTMLQYPGLQHRLRKGSVDFDGFMALMQDHTSTAPADPEKELREAFGVFDKAGKGFMDADDLRAILSTMGETLSDEEIDNMMAAVDASGSGKIVFEDFIKMMSSK
ncbi:hypothetical protein PRIPAC_90911 [Pristionchus pacificus]|uniref:HLH domain-containing protein n=1 Tax=Pristionchus pacificus TaxID=54126 RepID=A0A2A6B3P6_PRIPA|nr:hypothetical protein PRIPAC_90911 [Pristionchus pacificus]|eukprot:PDM60506.1 HLH domain-containing protein [Pristionchus pacificus]